MTSPGSRAVHPTPGPILGTVRVPSSKSVTNRALALAALASGVSRIGSPLLADDTVRMIRALRAMGVRIRAYGPGAAACERAIASGRFLPEVPAGEEVASSACGLEVAGRAGRLEAPAGAIDLGGAGTAMRFLAGLAALTEGEVILDGDARMRQRPIGPLLDALCALGVEASSLHGNGCPPVRVRGGGLRGGTVRIAGDVSSQFISAIVMIAPLAAEPVLIEIAPPLVSRPYIDLTLSVMERFGFEADLPRGPRGSSSRDSAAQQDPPGDGGRWEWRTVPSSYRAADYAVPPDASSASYFFAAAAVTRGRVTVADLSSSDSQGDIGFLDRLRAIGCLVEEDGAGISVESPAGGGRLRAFDFDLAGTPDLVPTLAVLALFADGPSEIRNVANLRLKESDRIAALAAELARLGARVEERADGLRIVPGPLHGARIETYGDHRMAMAFAVAGLAVPGISIVDPECVAKSFPTFWEVLGGLTGPYAG